MFGFLSIFCPVLVLQKNRGSRTFCDSCTNRESFLYLQSNKPIMEKKRRARINHCLNELKTLILEAMKKDVSWNLFLLVEIPRSTSIHVSETLSPSSATETVTYSLFGVSLSLPTQKIIS